MPGRRTIQCHRLIAVLEQPVMTKPGPENSMRRIRQLEQCSIEFHRLGYMILVIHSSDESNESDSPKRKMK